MFATNRPKVEHSILFDVKIVIWYFERQEVFSWRKFPSFDGSSEFTSLGEFPYMFTLPWQMSASGK